MIRQFGQSQGFRHWGLVLARGALLIMLGILAFSFPVLTIVSLATLIGALFLIGGGAEIVAAVSNRGHWNNWGMHLGAGILDALVGIVLLANPGATAAAIPIIVGIWAIAAGVFLFAQAFPLKQARLKGWWWSLLLGVATAAVGWWMITNPFVGALTVAAGVGWAAVLAGAAVIGVALQLRSWQRMVPQESTRGRRAA